jgi:hypothetical protein
VSGTRLVAKTEAAPFPYQAVKSALLALPAMEVGPVDFGRMIELGKRLGWSQEMIEGHESLRAGGQCFTFRQNQPPWLRGTFYEDNVFFEYADEKQEAAMRPLISQLARSLEVRVVEY